MLSFKTIRKLPIHGLTVAMLLQVMYSQIGPPSSVGRVHNQKNAM